MSTVSDKLSGLLVIMQQEDKAQHIICAFMSVLVLQLFLPMWQAAVAVFVAGLVKEAWDFAVGTGFCWYDITANTVGIVFTLICLFSWVPA